MSGEPAPVDLRLPPLLLRLFPDAPGRLSLQAARVSDLIDALEARWPGMGDCIRDSTPAIRRHINVFVDGRRVSIDTPLSPSADVYILTAISGG